MNLAVFDFDGTITYGDNFVPFLKFATSKRRWAVGGALLSPWIVAYKQGWLQASRMRQGAARVAFSRKAGRYLGNDCTGIEKKRRVLAHLAIAEFDAIYAYGDSPDDHELLSLAQHRFYRGQEVAMSGCCR